MIIYLELTRKEFRYLHSILITGIIPPNLLGEIRHSFNFYVFVAALSSLHSPRSTTVIRFSDNQYASSSRTSGHPSSLPDLAIQAGPSAFCRDVLLCGTRAFGFYLGSLRLELGVPPRDDFGQRSFGLFLPGEKEALNFGRRELALREAVGELVRDPLQFRKRQDAVCRVADRSACATYLTDVATAGLSVEVGVDRPVKIAVGQLLRRFGRIGRVHPDEKLSDLFLSGHGELHNHVYSPRPNESVVQFLGIVGRHDENSAFVRGNSVDGVE